MSRRLLALADRIDARAEQARALMGLHDALRRIAEEIREEIRGPHGYGEALQLPGQR